jgi:branched-chain amino acid transport system substrate-binding protein
MAFLSPSQKNSILISSLIIFGLTGLAIFTFTRPRQDNLEGTASKNSPGNSSVVSKETSGFNFGPFSLLGQPQGVSHRISSGDKVLVGVDNSPDKQEGVKLFKEGKYTEAIARFNDSLTLNRNDPEAWIYLNNAKALANGDFVKIAVVVPIGGNINVAKEILRGVAHYQYEVNNGSRIKGKFLQVEIANDDNSPSLAKQIASQLVEDKKVLAVIGHNSSDASIAVAPVYQEGELVMISPTSITRSLSGIGNYIFRTTPNSRAIASTLAKYSINSNKNKIAICADSSSQASKSFKEEFISSVLENGGQIIPTTCDFSASDFSPDDIPSSAISSGANTILLIPSVDRLKPAFEVARANRGRLSLLGNHTLYTYETLEQGRNEVKGMALSVFWHSSSDTGNPYPEKAKKFWGGYASWRTAMAYDALKVAVTGLNKSSGLSRQGLQKVISSADFSTVGATGLVKFEFDGDRYKPGTLVRIQPGKGSGTGFDFVALNKDQVPAIGGASLEN